VDKLFVIRQSFSCRLNGVLAERGIEETERLSYLAGLVGVSVYVPRSWLNAESVPSSQLLRLLAKRLGVHREWLISGRGEQYNEEPKRKRRG
jgi:transcriptional regulator with XRE-family HTH domain